MAVEWQTHEVKTKHAMVIGQLRVSFSRVGNTGGCTFVCLVQFDVI